MNRFHFVIVGLCLCRILMAFPPAAAGQLIEKVFYQFSGDSNGTISSLARDAAGNLYGTTYFGGTTGVGTVFKLDPTGNQTILYSFSGLPGQENADGGNPLGRRDRF